MMIIITWSVLRAYILLGSLMSRSLITIRSIRCFWVPTFLSYTLKPWMMFYYDFWSSRSVESCHLIFYQLSSWKLGLSYRYQRFHFHFVLCSTRVYLRKKYKRNILVMIKYRFIVAEIKDSKWMDQTSFCIQFLEGIGQYTFLWLLLNSE